MHADIQKFFVQKNKLTGTLYTQSNSEKRPGLLLLSGSDGGIPGFNAIPESFINYLVTNGFAVLALAYFGINDLPPLLENIPLEYFQTALEWLKTHPEIDPSCIGIVGQSRGAELALILGCYFHELTQAIVACSPSHLICGGFPHPNLPAWTYENRPITPYLKGLSKGYLSEAEDLKLAIESKKIPYHTNTSDDPYVIADLFLARYKMASAKKAEIPVEKIDSPILLLSGDQDAIWPSQYSCELIIKKSNMHLLTNHISYKNAGHGILSHYNGPIYHPIGQFWCKLGGTSEGNKTANEKSWCDINNFLQKTLSQKNNVE